MTAIPTYAPGTQLLQTIFGADVYLDKDGNVNIDGASIFINGSPVTGSINTLRSGAGVPGAGLGNNGDFYINTSASTIYGPKTAGAWGSPTSIVGPTGATGGVGPTGATGATGADGKTVRNGSGAPSNGLGVDGDFYINTAIWSIYGPKAAGVWPAGVTLVGPQGPAGSSVYTWAKVVRSTDQTPNGGVPISYDGLLEGSALIWSNALASRLIAPTSGLWRVTSHCRWTGTSAANFCSFIKNGGASGNFSRMTIDPAALGTDTFEHTWLATLVANDYIEHVYSGTNGAATYKGDAAGEFQWATMERIN